MTLEPTKEKTSNLGLWSGAGTGYSGATSAWTEQADIFTGKQKVKVLCTINVTFNEKFDSDSRLEEKEASVAD